MSMSEYTDGVGTSMIYTYESNAFEHIKNHKHTGVWHMRNCGGHSGYENIRLNFYDGDKPHWIHRLITRLLLGWKWEDRK
jgi:hypothetical protein